MTDKQTIEAIQNLTKVVNELANMQRDMRDDLYGNKERGITGLKHEQVEDNTARASFPKQLRDQLNDLKNDLFSQMNTNNNILVGRIDRLEGRIYKVESFKDRVQDYVSNLSSPVYWKNLMLGVAAFMTAVGTVLGFCYGLYSIYLHGFSSTWDRIFGK